MDIKLRAWTGEKYVYGPHGDEQNASWVLVMCAANKIEPELYTGINDKNNELIFGGDILKDIVLTETVHNGVATAHRIKKTLSGSWEVFWHEGGFSLRQSGVVCAIHFCSDTVQDAIIIGNINEDSQ